MKLTFKYIVSIVVTALLIAALPLQGQAQVSSPEASDLISAVHAPALKVNGLRAMCNIIREDPEFLKQFAINEAGIDRGSLHGVFLLEGRKGDPKFYCQAEGIDFYVFTIGRSGASYSGTQRVRGLIDKTESPKVVEDLGNTLKDKGASDSNEASPSPSPSPSPSTDFPEAGDSYAKLNAASSKVLSGHPLIYLKPYALHDINVSAHYALRSKKAPILGHNCWLVRETNHNQNYYTDIWIDPQLAVVWHIERVDLNDMSKLEATYLDYYTPDAKTGLSFYKRVEVLYNGRPIYLAEMSEVTVNPDIKVKKSKKDLEQEEKSARMRRARSLLTDEVIPVLSKNMAKFVSFLSLILGVLALRFLWFRLARREFSDELIVVDEEDGRFSEMLDKLGYHIVRFAPELLTQERNLLGRGATKDTDARPRSVIIAPQCIREIKDYLFLLQAYIEEGGRVMVMYHSPKDSGLLPFEAEFMPNPASGLQYEHDPNILPGLPGDVITRLCGEFSGPETYISLNGRKLRRPLIKAVQKDLKVESALIASIRFKKGEFTICQLQFTPANTMRNRNMQILLNDLMRHFLGLAPIYPES